MENIALKNKHDEVSTYCDSKTMVEVQNLFFQYRRKKPVLKNLNFKIERGAFHGLIGSNGSGKSTIMKILIGALINQSGNIFINGQNINQTKNKQELRISYFPDESRFPLGFSTYEYLKYEAMVAKGKDKFIKQKIQKLLDEFLLRDIMHKSPNRLSSGQKKKVEIIRLMLEEPEFIILDEPSNYLDPQSRQLLYDCLNWFHKKGVTILISSHILDELKLHIDSATIIDQGEVKFNGVIVNKDLTELYNSISHLKLEVLENEEIF